MPWSIHDAVQLERMNIPTVTVCTDKFAGFAREKATAFKAVDLPLVSIPHPITGRRPAEIVTLASDAFSDVVRALTTAPKWNSPDDGTGG